MMNKMMKKTVIVAMAAMMAIMPMAGVLAANKAATTETETAYEIMEEEAGAMNDGCNRTTPVKGEHSGVIDKPVLAPIYEHDFDFRLFGGNDGKTEYVMHKLPNGDVINDTYEDLKEVKNNKGIWQNIKTKEYFAEKKGDERLIRLYEEQDALSKKS